ncbi:unnamed protein product [Paramecium sonneborni]|nr:unnamed protein product [Paramecium sonneborni]
MRSLLILLRWNSALIIGEVLCLSQFEYQVSIWIILASIIILRLSENFFKKRIKYFFILRQQILVTIIKIFLLLILIFTVLCELYFYFMIVNQTNLIVSYSGAILIDVLLIDIIIFSANRFLGENKKKNIRKRIKELKQLTNIQKEKE